MTHDVKPTGYWPRVFDQAKILLDQRGKDLTPEQAYWQARQIVDESLPQPDLHLVGKGEGSHAA